MQAAINSPQSKSVSITFLALKMTIFILIVTNTIKTMAHSQSQHLYYSQTHQLIKPCPNKLLSFASIIQIFNLLGCILNIFCLIYFFCQNDFRCMEYYVFYVYNVVLLLASVIGSLTTRTHNKDTCDYEEEFLLAISGVTISWFVVTLIMMWSNLYFSLKYAHFGSNIVWFLIWVFGGSCQSALVMLVALIHGILSVAGIFLFLANKFMKKTALTAKIWRAATFISLIAMIFCYIIILLGLLAGKSCESAQFFKKVYQLYGIIQIIGPSLVLIFLRSEQGDPRQKIIKNHEQVFQRLYQHQNIDLKEKQ